MKTREEITKDLVDSYKKNSSIIYCISMRFGKTRLAIELIKKNKPKSILWVTPNSKLRDIDIPNEFKKWKSSNWLKKTNIVCYASLSKVYGDYDMIILDKFLSK